MNRPSRSSLTAFVLVVCATLLAAPARAQFTQQGSKLVASDLFGAGYQGWSVAISADGNTAIVGAPQISGYLGAATIWTRDNGVWTQQGPSLRGSGVSSTYSLQGQSVSLSADGNTAAVGASGDVGKLSDGSFASVGAVWIWTRSAGVWSQQGPKLVSTGAVGYAEQGSSVALSADGNTVIVGGPYDNNLVGAAWVWTRSGGIWTQQGAKLVGSGAVGASQQGYSVALSADGNTALVGGNGDDNAAGAGAVWIWTRSGNTWSQQGPKLTGLDRVGVALQGGAVSLASDGDTAIVGGVWDNFLTGAVWVWTRSGGIWNRQGPKLVGSGAVPAQAGYGAFQGTSVSLSGDGNTAIVGGFGDDSHRGATWVWTRGSGTWTQQGSKLVGSGAASPAEQGFSVALSTDGKTAIVAGRSDNGNIGAVWIFATPQAPVIATHPASRIVLAGATVTFTAGVTANPAATVQWQISTNGGTVFTDISGATSPSYSFTTAAPNNGHRYRAVFTNSSGSATTNAATLTVTASPTVALDRTALRFSAVTSGAGFSSQTAAQTVHLTKTGAGTVTWTAVSNAPWLVVSPTSGSGSAALTISTQFASGLGASQTGSVTLTFTGAGNTAGPIGVVLTTASSTDPASLPFGVFDTPVGDTTILEGSIAVTGWTLDNVGVKRVEIWRDLQAGETTPPFASTPGDPRTGKVFIANATFVDGARPDVEALFPTTPFAYRAGWGYLLLTWGLASQGNGTYSLYAFAFDQEDNVATIGTKSIIVSNNSATRPFGSIDTPAIGGFPAAGDPNFGWALTPKVGGLATCTIPPSGVQVSIDSGVLQPVAYGDNRTDIAGAFPGFSNSNGAGGHYIFDWTTLANGTHTISWYVTDDCNRADGIGSRFFNVTAGASGVAGSTAASVTGLPESREALTVAHGFGELPRILSPDDADSRTIEVRQGERIEIRLPRGFDTAFQLVAGERRPMPIGATWDAASQTLSWQPAAGFLGRYRIVFSNGSQRISVRVVVVP